MQPPTAFHDNTALEIVKYKCTSQMHLRPPAVPESRCIVSCAREMRSPVKTTPVVCNLGVLALMGQFPQFWAIDWPMTQNYVNQSAKIMEMDPKSAKPPILHTTHLWPDSRQTHVPKTSTCRQTKYGKLIWTNLTTEMLTWGVPGTPQ